MPRKSTDIAILKVAKKVAKVVESAGLNPDQQKRSLLIAGVLVLEKHEPEEVAGGD